MLLDTLRLSRVVHPGPKGHALSALVARYHLEGHLAKLNLQPHRALYDATATMLVFSALCVDLGQPTISLGDLSRLCEVPCHV
ncbi:MAG: hypothetical protein ACYCT0_12740 [Sulfobacillus sp.]